MWKKISLLLALIAVPIVVTAQEPRVEMTFVMPCKQTTEAERLYHDSGRLLVYEGHAVLNDLSFQLWRDQSRWFILLKIPEKDATCLLIYGDELKLKSTI